MFGSCVLNWDFNGSLSDCLNIQYITSNFISVDLVFFQHIENSWIKRKFKWWNLLSDSVQSWFNNTYSSTELFFQSVITVLNCPSFNSSLNRFSPLWTFKTKSKGFQSSVNLFCWNTFSWVDFLELSEQLNKLNFILLIFGKLLISWCSTGSTLIGQSLSFNF